MNLQAKLSSPFFELGQGLAFSSICASFALYFNNQFSIFLWIMTATVLTLTLAQLMFKRFQLSMEFKLGMASLFIGFMSLIFIYYATFRSASNMGTLLSQTKMDAGAFGVVYTPLQSEDLAYVEMKSTEEVSRAENSAPFERGPKY